MSIIQVSGVDRTFSADSKYANVDTEIVCEIVYHRPENQGQDIVM